MTSVVPGLIAFAPGKKPGRNYVQKACMECSEAIHVPNLTNNNINNLSEIRLRVYHIKTI
jgi:hypothetical protein